MAESFGIDAQRYDQARPRYPDELVTRIVVEVSTFEAWEPAGRKFDIVIAAQSWRWIDPVAGALNAAEVQRPNGRMSIFGHVFEPPPEVAESFTAALTRPSAINRLAAQ